MATSTHNILTPAGLSKAVCAVMASAYGIYYALTAQEWHLIDNVDLVIHEAGHLIFSPFGMFIYILGGSLFQVLFPCIYVAYFYYKKSPYSASIILFWVGISTINVSVYAADAVRMQLPLLGGDSTIHDWHYLLDTLHLLSYTDTIGRSIDTFGICIILLAIGGSIYFAFVPKAPVNA